MNLFVQWWLWSAIKGCILTVDISNIYRINMENMEISLYDFFNMEKYMVCLKMDQAIYGQWTDIFFIFDICLPYIKYET